MAFAIILILICIGIYTCTSTFKIDHEFRKTYTEIKEAAQGASPDSVFFKVHFKNGAVCVFENWELTLKKDSIKGNGKLFDFNRNLVKEGVFTFNLESIAIIETNQIDAIKSKDNERIAALAILTSANIALNIVCITNPKACFGSCPTFYINEDAPIYAANAEAFSSAIAPSLERSDLDALQFSTLLSEFSILMKNEALETHVVNQVNVFAVPKQRSQYVFHDQYQNFYLCERNFIPKKVMVNDKNITCVVREIDELEYFSQTDTFDLLAKEEMILEFDQLPMEELGVVLNFRQSLLTTFLLYSGLSYMGDEVGDIFSLLETNMILARGFGDPFRRLGKINISYWNPQTNQWESIEALHETGPIAKNLMIVPLKNKSPKDGKLKLKIQLTKGHWRLDYVGLTLVKDEPQPFIATPVKLESINGNLSEVSYLQRDDEKYLVTFPGNQYRIHFKFPLLEQEKEYELFLASKGYYLEWMRKPWLEGKNISKLKRIIQNDPTTWKELAIEFKEMESEMESVFWNSYYSRTQ